MCYMQSIRNLHVRQRISILYTIRREDLLAPHVWPLSMRIKFNLDAVITASSQLTGGRVR